MVQAVPARAPRAPQYLGLRLSADEYLALPDDGFKYQVINGVVVMSPRPTPRHQLVLSAINAQLFGYLESNPIATAFPEVDVRFAPDLVYCPDLVVLSAGKLANAARRIDAVPDLVIEVVSPGSESMDRRTKLADYERFGVTEYWIVSATDPVAVQVLRLHDGRFAEAPPAGSDRIESVAIKGFALDLARVRRALARRDRG